MSLLYRILYAAHAKGTHHKLALDALRHLRNPDAERWQRLFLKHAELLMQGSKAPDDEFKDFKNHVLHVRDGFWGGAPDKVEAWYGHLVNALKAQSWSEAAWAAGVLSHYYSDPIHPFHTAQSEAENSIHRAAEWSINRSYDSLRAEGEAEHPDLAVMATMDQSWLRDLVCQGAERSNAHYERLIAHYDLKAGVVDPPAGLDAISRRVIAELLVYAAKGIAVILDRAFTEAAVTPPDVDLALDTVLAAVKMPAKMLAKKLADAEDRRIVEAMYDELKTTGRVEATLPEDDRVVRDLYEKEVLAPAKEVRAAERDAVVADRIAVRKSKPPRPTTVATRPPAPASASQERHHPAATAHLAPGNANAARTHLAPADRVERAPSIGPRLAERLSAHNVKTVADLLSADPHALAASLGDRRIAAETIVSWQNQSKLMIDIPGLRGGHAQLLTGAGFASRDALVAIDADQVCAAVLSYAATPEGQRVLRDTSPPDVEKIKAWLDAAHAARAA